jgi:hypothetical protein
MQEEAAIFAAKPKSKSYFGYLYHLNASKRASLVFFGVGTGFAKVSLDNFLKSELK